MQRKTAKKEACWPKCTAPRLGYEKNQRQHIVALTWVTKIKSLSRGESLNVVQKVNLLFLLGYFVFMGLYLRGNEGGRKEWTKRRGARCRELTEDEVLSCCVTYQVPGGGREMEGGGSIGKGWMAGGTGLLG